MIGFQSDPAVKFVGSVVRLLEPLVFKTKAGETILVPAGFECDLDSRPGWLPGFIRVWMASPIVAAEPAILHDFLYRNGGYDTPHGFVPCGKMFADRVLFEALGAKGDTAVSRWLFWGGLFVGGAPAWYGHRWSSTRG